MNKSDNAKNLAIKYPYSFYELMRFQNRVGLDNYQLTSIIRVAATARVSLAELDEILLGYKEARESACNVKIDASFALSGCSDAIERLGGLELAIEKIRANERNDCKWYQVSKWSIWADIKAASKDLIELP